MQRRVGQESTQGPLTRCQGLRQGRIVQPREHDDRPVAPGEGGQLRRSEGGMVLDGLQVGEHHGERFLPSALSSPQFGDDLGTRRVAGQVVAPQALDGDDPSFSDQPPGSSDRLVPAQDLPPFDEQLDRRAAVRAGDRLGVKATVRRILILGSTRRAHREVGHGRERPVVRHGLDQRQSRPAMGAVDEWIAVAPVGRIEQLAQAVRAGRHVGGYRLEAPFDRTATRGCGSHPGFAGGRAARPDGRYGPTAARRIPARPGSVRWTRPTRRPRCRRRRRCCAPSPPARSVPPGYTQRDGSQPPGRHRSRARGRRRRSRPPHARPWVASF